MKLSIIIPVLNEEANIECVLGSLSVLRGEGVQVVVVDGGSADRTAELAAPLADLLLHSACGRALQMNAGAQAASGEILLFLHADTVLPDNAHVLVSDALGLGRSWGRFDVAITGKAFMLNVVAWLMNRRSRLTGIATGDQAIFVRRDAFFAVGGFPSQPLMEDIELSARLRRHSQPACLRERVRTSGRRWEQKGVWCTIFLMWRLRFLYWLGSEPEKLAKAYR
ncbi:TIGR04283 family arsenosugar biosynthesis glycosyltransferase [Oxalobacteraceae bacterium R-40]|uniref:TIGR04283 family arsenosugar biosynthesis glycosyltransferase n=1 Tax=Keguizhuia sedimenti TaxID=3064264 RepID=A0ABU1BT14_9BURK|nr:TIGR04283 family arsenosugar biosynthesis glycosyltransferase [Oxalobacteraceae bacterium R-40]